MDNDRKKHFPSDRELDDIKQLLDTRTIHIQLGCNPDADWEITDAFVEKVRARILTIFGKHALNTAEGNMRARPHDIEASRSFRSMYDTALMRMWWEKFGGTVDVRRSVGNGEASGRLGSAASTDADEAAQLLQEGADK